ncbi:hypothetical protein J2Y03_000887 [Neobacillus niacini]|nr:hypothetical protein [Neobacillus niacini]
MGREILANGKKYYHKETVRSANIKQNIGGIHNVTKKSKNCSTFMV